MLPTGLARLTALLAAPLLLAAGCAPGVDLQTSRKFQQAQQTFDEASSPEAFLRAAGLCQEILDAGVVSGAVLYNQGNAFMRAGHRGRALAAYRRALRYRPRDEFLQANLRFARGDNPTAGRRAVIEYLFFWQDWLGYREKFILLAAPGGVTFVLGLLVLFRRRRVYFRLALAGVGVTLLAAASAGYDWYRFDCLTHGVVIRKEVIARKGNATTAEPAFTEPLSEGAELRLAQRRGDWLLIRLPGGGQGWVEEAAVVLY